jgi:hypothetical protein
MKAIYRSVSEGISTPKRRISQSRWLWHIVGALALFVASTGSVFAETTITGTVGTTGAYLVTGAPVATTADAVLKISFENLTSGTNLALCAGTPAQFTAHTCGTELSDSGGPGFTFLTIVDTAALSGKVIYVLREVGTLNSTFQMTIE